MDYGRNRDKWRRGEAEVSKSRTHNTGHRRAQWGGRLEQDGTWPSTLQEIGSDSLHHGQWALSRAGGEEAEAPGLVLSCKNWGLAGENYMWLSRIASHSVFLESQAGNTQFNLASIESRCRMGKGRRGLKNFRKVGVWVVVRCVTWESEKLNPQN